MLRGLLIIMSMLLCFEVLPQGLYCGQYEQEIIFWKTNYEDLLQQNTSMLNRLIMIEDREPEVITIEPNEKETKLEIGYFDENYRYHRIR